MAVLYQFSPGLRVEKLVSLGKVRRIQEDRSEVEQGESAGSLPEVLRSSGLLLEAVLLVGRFELGVSEAQPPA